jgi:hypothetical protein
MPVTRNLWPRLARRLRFDQRGVTLIEFAVVAPVMLIAIMGIMDLGHRSYAVALLQGSVQKAARDSGLETGNESASDIDARVKGYMKLVLPDDTDYNFVRTSYTTFSDVSQPEDFTDLNDDGFCNNGEVFEDANGNDVWDEDRGLQGQGGARDAVLYTATVSYPRLFPLAGLAGMPEETTISASTVMRNQPFGEQSVPEPSTGNCDDD